MSKVNSNQVNIDALTIAAIFKAVFPDLNHVSCEVLDNKLPVIKLSGYLFIDPDNDIGIYIASVLNQLTLTVKGVQVEFYNVTTELVWRKIFCNSGDGFKEQDFNQLYRMSMAIVLIMLGVLAMTSIGLYKFIFPSSDPASTYSQRVLIGKSPTGYEIWRDANCAYAKNVTQADLDRLNTNLDGLKKVIESQTGTSCVIFE